MNDNEYHSFMATLGKFLLAILGPVWLPVYWIWQLMIGLVGVCYYLVIERTQNVLSPAKINSRTRIKIRWFLVPLLFIGLVPALAVQLLVAVWQLLIWWHRLLGSWQTGFQKTIPALLAGVLTEIIFLIVFVGSQYHPLPLKLIGAEYNPMNPYWFRSEGDDPTRVLLTGPILIGLFSLVLIPTILARVWPGLRKIVFFPAMILSMAVLFNTLKSFDPSVNLRWVYVACGLFILVLLLSLMILSWRTLHRSTALRQFVWFFAIRLLEKKRIALFSLAAVTLCTAMLLIIISVMGGFVEQVKEKSHGLMGDIIIEGDKVRGFPYYEDFIKQLKKIQIVADAAPVIYTAGLLRVQDPNRPNSFWTNTVRIEGIDLAGHIAVTKFGSGLHRHSKDPNSVILSKPVQPPGQPQAEKLYGLIYGLDIGGFSYRDPDGVYHRYIPNYTSCMISVIPLTVSGKILDAATPARTQKFYMVDDSRTKVYDIDANYVYVDFNVLQKILYMEQQKTDDNETIPARTTQIHIKLKPNIPLNDQTLKTISAAWFDYADGLNDRDNPLLGRVDVNRWETYNAPLISAVENEKRLMIMLFGIISIVAVFLILAIFYMIVVEKTRDIGILKSIGASAYQIAAIFLAYGGVIGFIGSILGTILGYYFVEHINQVQDWLINVFGWRVWNREVYAFDQIPSRVETWDVTIIIIAAIVASVIGALVPAIRAARMNPVEALRYE